VVERITANVKRAASLPTPMVSTASSTGPPKDCATVTAKKAMRHTTVNFTGVKKQ